MKQKQRPPQLCPCSALLTLALAQPDLALEYVRSDEEGIEEGEPAAAGRVVFLFCQHVRAIIADVAETHVLLAWDCSRRGRAREEKEHY